MRKELKCPYCGEFNSEPDDCNEQDEVYFKTCASCEKVFGFNVSYTKHFDEFETPCQNEGGEHDWQPIKGYPRKIYINKYRCSHCQEEKVIKK